VIRPPAAPCATAARAGHDEGQGGKVGKLFATLQARAALAGVELVRSTDDHGREVFVASRWALTAQFASLSEVETWLQGFGGREE
jgi:hypothetical protein